MSAIRTSDIKTGAFDTWAQIEQRRGGDVKAVQVKLDHRAATRQAIVVALRKQGKQFQTRSEWKAKLPSVSPDRDWDYHSIALHHAGNSYSCHVDSVQQLRKAESTDIKRFGHISYHYALGCDGTIYEALDIRNKGAHISEGNTGVIGIVMLSDLSMRGEAYQQEYKEKSLAGRIRGVADWLPDKVDSAVDEPPEVQLNALFALVKILIRYFPIKAIGGHREFQRLATHEGRACPGIYGMILVDMLRSETGVSRPK